MNKQNINVYKMFSRPSRVSVGAGPSAEPSVGPSAGKDVKFDSASNEIM